MAVVGDVFGLNSVYDKQVKNVRDDLAAFSNST